MSTGRSKVESRTNARGRNTVSLVKAPAAMPGSLGCRRLCCGKIKECVPTVNCSRLTLAKTDRLAIVRQLYILSQQTISVV